MSKTGDDAHAHTRWYDMSPLKSVSSNTRTHSFLPDLGVNEQPSDTSDVDDDHTIDDVLICALQVPRHRLCEPVHHQPNPGTDVAHRPLCGGKYRLRVVRSPAYRFG